MPLDVGDGRPDRLASLGLSGLEQDLVRLGLAEPAVAGSGAEADDGGGGEDGDAAAPFEWPKDAVAPAGGGAAGAAGAAEVRPAYRIGPKLLAAQRRLEEAEAKTAKELAAALALAKHHLSPPGAAMDVRAAREGLHVSRALLVRLGAAGETSGSPVPPAAAAVVADSWAREAAELEALEAAAAEAAAALLREGEAQLEESRRLAMEGHALKVSAIIAAPLKSTEIADQSVTSELQSRDA